MGTIYRRRWGGSGAKGGGLEVSNAGWLARNTPLPVSTYLPGRANTKHHLANWLIPCQTCGNSPKYVSSFMSWSALCHPPPVSHLSVEFEIGPPDCLACSSSSFLLQFAARIPPGLPHLSSSACHSVYVLTSRRGYRQRIDICSREKSSWHALFNSSTRRALFLINFLI